MAIDPSATVRDLAVSIPGATRLFEEHRIDYCCRGAHSLERACTTAGVEPERVIAQLEQLAARADDQGDPLRWPAAPLPELVAHIVSRHHDYTRTELERLGGLASKVLTVHGPKHPWLADVKARVDALADDLLPHLRKEEGVLFPYIEALAAASAAGRPLPRAPFGTVANPVRMMMTEHEQTAELLRAARAATADFTPPDGACATWRALYSGLRALERDLFEHIHLESNILFPRAVELETH